MGLVVLAGVTLAVITTTLALGRTDHSLETRTYQAVAGPVADPERGWYEPVNIVSDRDFSAETAAGVTLVFSYVRLDDYRHGRLPKRLLTQLGYGLDAVKDSGLKIILRFTYNFGPPAGSSAARDAPKAQILQHIHQLGPVLRKHAAVIAAVQAGFIGAWGEWHDSVHGLDHDPSAKEQIVEAERVEFPGQLMLRYPADIRAISNPSPHGTVGGAAITNSIGMHQDCFLASDPDDRGTWGEDGHSVSSDKALAAAVGRYAVVGGETCGVSDRTTCSTALSELASMEFTFLNRQYDPDSLAQLSDCADEISERLGYRLELTSAAWPRRLSHGAEALQVRLDLENAGFASPYAARPAYVVLACGRSVQRLRLKSDPRTWDAGKTEVSQRLTIDPPGNGVDSCRIGLALPDASRELASLPDYAIRLASSTTWSDGVNWLGTVPVSD